MRWWLVCMTLAGGVCVSFQAAVNGVLGRKIGMLETSFFSFCIGTLMLGALVFSIGRGQFSELGKVPLWCLTGGILGAAYVFILVYTVPKMGVSAAVLGIIVGQVCASVFIDHQGLFGERIPLDTTRLLAIAMLGGSLYLFNKT